MPAADDAVRVADLDADPRAHAARRTLLVRLVPLFAISGVAALVYQICWQRLLFAAFGVDIESITIIVSAFMLGLGIGALAGGALADRYRERIPELFAASELAIGVCGFASPSVIAWVANLTALSAPPVVAGANFALLILPTTLMGATLPMLVTHCMRTYRSIGEAIGVLYFVNTLGAAIGAAATGFIGFYFFGLRATIYGAALLNLIVAALAWTLLRSRRV